MNSSQHRRASSSQAISAINSFKAKTKSKNKQLASESVVIGSQSGNIGPANPNENLPKNESILNTTSDDNPCISTLCNTCLQPCNINFNDNFSKSGLLIFYLIDHSLWLLMVALPPSFS